MKVRLGDGNAQLSRRAYQAYGEMIQKAARWTWWVTLTFRAHVADDDAKRLLSVWLRKVAQQIVDGHVRVHVAMDRQAMGWLHFHVLLDGPSPVNAAQFVRAKELWVATDGRCDADVLAVAYDPSRAAPWYHAKHGSGGFETICPRDARCRRARGCLVARAPLRLE